MGISLPKIVLMTLCTISKNVFNYHNLNLLLAAISNVSNRIKAIKIIIN